MPYNWSVYDDVQYWSLMQSDKESAPKTKWSSESAPPYTNLPTMLTASKPAWMKKESAAQEA